MVKFASQGNIEFKLNDFYNKTALIARIRRTRYGGGRTNTAAGILRMRTEVFNSIGDRPDVPNLSIVITDGISTVSPDQTIPNANDAKREGIRMLAVGVTNVTSRAELAGISSSGVEGETFWNSPDFRALGDILSNIVEQTCQDIGK